MPGPSYDVTDGADTKVPESKKPDNTAFKQQRLPAWQPILTAKSVLPTFFIIAILFIPLGAVFLVTSNSVIEVSEEYTNCFSLENPSMTCSIFRGNSTFAPEQCTCQMNINVTSDMQGTVYVYYGLTNFFQNHRRYVKSRDDMQLVGEPTTVSTVSSDCSPFDKVTELRNGVNVTLPIAPCGAIANSLFNDTYTLTKPDSSSLNISRTGIAWDTDHTLKFNNPCDNLTECFEETAKPVYWQRSVIQLDPDTPDNNGYKNEAFEVWMRTAAFPTFRKPYGRIVGGLPAGIYNLTINYTYPVAEFHGTKRFILATTSWMGGKNNFLGIAYITVGTCSFVVAIALCFLHYCSNQNKVH
ncbi:cell cycle control protein 50A-like [Clavelina lepadiformis]|uniref:cell cycle control protein 50A-like n=1 Tax=Clavelina lepadiformis TaxID=159417 RepID=UPI004042E462